MGTYLFKMPDIGEGIVEAEVVAWHVAVGDKVAEDAAVADVMTDKATVEVTSPVDGTILSLGCAAGEKMVIGSPFIEFEVAGAGQSQQSVTAPKTDPTGPVVTEPSDAPVAQANANPPHVSAPPSSKPKIRVVSDGEVTAPAVVTDIKTPLEQPREAAGAQAEKENSADHFPDARPKVVDISPRREIVAASPAVRRLARDLGIDLSSVKGSGPAGRVINEDIRALLTSPVSGAGEAMAAKSTERVIDGGEISASRQGSVAKTLDTTNSGGAGGADEQDAVTDVPVIGLRRLIAERMQTAKQRIPHFSYVEEVCVDQLEELRQHMNANRAGHQPKLSVLHFVLMAVSREVVNWPQCNAHFDDDNSVLQQHAGVHLGVATMTDAGLMVPVVSHACQRDIWEIAREVNRLAEAARNGSLAREELSGSTITVTSLGALAGITTTPVINRPETSIVGPNKIMQKVVWKSGTAVPVNVMNLSSSFDHRVVDGYDAACFIQAVKTRLERPALLFI